MPRVRDNIRIAGRISYTQHMVTVFARFLCVALSIIQLFWHVSDFSLFHIMSKPPTPLYFNMKWIDFFNLTGFTDRFFTHWHTQNTRCVAKYMKTPHNQLGYGTSFTIAPLSLDLFKSYRTSRRLFSALWAPSFYNVSNLTHPLLLSLPFTVTTGIVLHGNRMINEWTHLPGFSSIIEPCCHAAETKPWKPVCLPWWWQETLENLRPGSHFEFLLLLFIKDTIYQANTSLGIFST